MNTPQIPSHKQAWRLTLCAIGLGFALFQQALPCRAAGAVVAWGDNDSTQSQVPASASSVVEVAGGESHSLALRTDGAVVAWGYNDSGQTNVPSGLNGVGNISAGANFSLALKTNGTVVVWGGLSAPPAGLTNVMAIAAGWSHALALQSNGTVVAWGSQPTVPSGLSNVKAIAAGNGQSLALLTDGTVVAWGDSSYGKTSVPTGLSNVLAVAAGGDHCLALKTDGTIVAWGRNDYGQATVPANINNAVGISGGALHSLALRADGSLTAWGNNTFNQTITTPGDAGYIGISAGGYHNLAIKGDGSAYILESPLSQTVLINKSATFQVVATGLQPLTYLWQHNGKPVNSATTSTLSIPSVQSLDGGIYVAIVGNLYGSVTSAPALLTAVAGLPVVTTPPQNATVICGDSATFQVSAGGSTPLSYQWLFQGNPILSATNSQLTLNSVDLTQAGPYDVVITNSFGSVTTGAVLTVTVATPQITSPLSALIAQGQPFTYTITALHSPHSFGATFLPAGLSIDANSGIISGVPTESGEFSVLISAVNACASDNETLDLTVAPDLPVITSPANANATEGQSFTYQVTALNSPISYDAQNLPVGLTIDPVTGIISGIPTYAGVFDATIFAYNIWGPGTANLHFVIGNANIDNLQIGNVTYNYSSPYLLDFQFSLFTLTDQNDPNSAVPVVVDPKLLSAVAMEDDLPISPSETGAFIATGNAKVTKIFLVLDFTESIASLNNGDLNTNGISDAVDAILSGSQDFVTQQTADTQIGVYEFHREDFDPSNVVALTTDKVLLNNSIAGILTNYVQGFSAGSRAWDATAAAIKDLGSANPDEEHFVILISDGRDESSTTTLQAVIKLATGNSVKVFSIGFGTELEVTNMQNLANSTQGNYFAATNAQELARQLSLVSKTAKGQYVLRWATLKRAARAFLPSFAITYQSLTANSPTNPWYVDTNNPIIDTNQTPPVTNYNNITNFIIGYFYPNSNAGPVTVGALRVVPNADIHPTGLDLRATYVPRYIQQVRLHYRANWPCVPSLQNTNLGEWLAGWTMNQTDDGAGGTWLLLSSPSPTNYIPFASFGKMVTFTFRDVIDTTNAFSFFDVDNSLYTLTGGQSFVLGNTNEFITSFPLLPHGTPVPWLISYGFIANYTNAELLDPDKDGMPNWKEYWSNTNPTNAASVFKIKQLIRQPDGRFRITFSSSTNRLYRVQGSADLTNWQIIQDNISGNNQDITIVDKTVIPNITNVYYRVQVY
jgi:hypothetical protein